jgi:hypothetical protein
MIEPLNAWLVLLLVALVIIGAQRARIRQLRRDHEELARVIKSEADEQGTVWLCDLARRHGHPSRWDTEEVDGDEAYRPTGRTGRVR